MQTNTATKPQIQIKRVYQHPIQSVWNALTTKEALSEWLMPSMDFELVQGHSFQFKSKAQGSFDGIINCKIMEIQPPRLIIYSWAAKGFKQPTIVTWELQQIAEEKTSLTLSHSGFTGFNGWVTKQILSLGWKRLLGKKLSTFLQSKSLAI